MKLRTAKRATEGDSRTVKKFVILDTLRYDVDYKQTRFLELAEITQRYNGKKWVDFSWNK